MSYMPIVSQFYDIMSNNQNPQFRIFHFWNLTVELYTRQSGSIAYIQI
uniref:Uncharacterized protein n=1 Tax=Anguilla anguilla TaxID=7936 RepID=A0A0E9RLT4_ANGAN